jgi:hypothetical protein
LNFKKNLAKKKLLCMEKKTTRSVRQNQAWLVNEEYLKNEK